MRRTMMCKCMLPGDSKIRTIEVRIDGRSSALLVDGLEIMAHEPQSLWHRLVSWIRAVL